MDGVLRWVLSIGEIAFVLDLLRLAFLGFVCCNGDSDLSLELESRSIRPMYHHTL